MGMLFEEGRTRAQQDEAHHVLELLTVCYPGHPWAVLVDHGIVFIRHLEFPGNWGMNIKTGSTDHDAAVLKKKIIMAAGEFLERAGLARGRANGDEIQKVEGVPDRFQPHPEKQTIHFEAVIDAAAPSELRTAPRPQAVKMEGDD